MNSKLFELVNNILSEHLYKTLSKKKAQQIAGSIVKAVLMTREGTGLPEEGNAVTFKQEEVKPAPKPEEEVVQEKKEEKPFRGRTAIVAVPIDMPGMPDVMPVTVQKPFK